MSSPFAEPNLSQPKKTSQHQARQFTIAQVMAATCAVGVVMAIVHYLGFIPTVALTVFFSPVLIPIAVWLVGARRANRLVELLVILMVAGISVYAIMVR